MPLLSATTHVRGIRILLSVGDRVVNNLTTAVFNRMVEVIVAAVLWTLCSVGSATTRQNLLHDSEERRIPRVTALDVSL